MCYGTEERAAIAGREKPLWATGDANGPAQLELRGAVEVFDRALPQVRGFYFHRVDTQVLTDGERRAKCRPEPRSQNNPRRCHSTTWAPCH